jgi:hypothetical protein
MTTNAVSDNSEIIVSGKDMFGALFSEKSPSPVSRQVRVFLSRCSGQSLEEQPLQVSFEPQSNHCVEGLVTSVKNRLDGMQTVEVKVLNSRN